MKKALALLIAFVMVFSIFAGCSKKKTTNSNTPSTSGTSNPNPSTSISSSESNSTLDSEKVHPSDDATIKVAGSAAPLAMIVLGNNSATAPMQVTGLFFDTLVTYDINTGDILPNLATEWEWLDNLTIRFKLRDDVYSHLGDKFTASDAVFSFQWGCETAKLNNIYNSYFDMENTKVVDEYTFDLALKTPNPYVLIELSRFFYQFAVEASVEKIGGKEACAHDSSCGTGPYKLVKWDEVNNVVYAERNEDYWGVKPYYKNYEYYIVVDTTARGMGVEAGDYDVCVEPTSTSAIAATNNKDISVYFTPSSTTIRWDLNSDREPFNVKEVRQALALAVNYDAISQVSYSGYATKIDSPYSANQPWHTSPADGEEEFYYYYDIDRAREKLVSAGYADGFDMHILIVSGRSYIASACEIIANTLKQLNINVTIDQYESATYGAYFDALDYDSVMNTATSPTPMNYLKTCDGRFIGSGNTTGAKWHEEIADFYDIVDSCKNTTDMTEAYANLGKFQDLLREYVPFIPVCNPNTFNMTTSDIINIAFDPVGNPIFSSFYPAEYIEG